MEQGPINSNFTVADKHNCGGAIVRGSLAFVVRHILAASWEDSESSYHEDGGGMLVRNVGSYYWSHTVSNSRRQHTSLLPP